MDIERDEMEVGVLFVGAGPATLSGAIRLMDLIEEHNEKVESGAIEGEPIDIDEYPIMVIEKGAEIGDQILSGACVDPRAFFDLFTDEFLEENPPPFNHEVTDDTLAVLLPPTEEEWGSSLLGKIVRTAVKTPDAISCTLRKYLGLDLPKFIPEDKALRSPFIPPTFHNEGNQVASLNEIVKWMAEIAEEKGVMIMPEFPGADLLIEDDRVVGVRTGDKGVDRHGKPKGNFEPGTDIKARLVVLGEGARGSLTKLLIHKYDLDKDANHQIYSTGVKELWKVLPGRIRPGQVIHTAGYPLDGDTFGGGFIYGLTDDQVALGLVTALDSPDPYLDPHRKFNEWKNHPFVKNILDGGELIRYGAKTIPEGGWFSLPRPYAAGAVLVGDSAGFVNISRLKGIHLAMKSGILAGETGFEILKTSPEQPVTAEMTASYWHKVIGSWLFQELWDVRNFRQGFQRSLLGLPGMLSGSVLAGAGFALAGLLALLALVVFIVGFVNNIAFTPVALGLLLLSFLMAGASLPLGQFPLGRMDMQADHERIRKIDIGGWARQSKDSDPLPKARLPGISAAADQVQFNEANPGDAAPLRPIDPNAPKHSIGTDGLVYNKETSVYYSGSTHEEDQPAHLVVADTSVCHTRCAEEYGNPCQYFCPAQVYEMVTTDDGKGRQLQLNFSNCVHCKTCDVRDPYQIITWVPPEGGGGPSYAGL